MQKVMPPVSHLTQGSSYLNLTINNFGPVSKADIALKPLTVFIGPSNTGKSYLARLIYSIMNAEATLLSITAKNGLATVPTTKAPHNRILAQIEKNLLQDKGHNFRLPARAMQALSRSAVHDLLSVVMQGEIEGNFGMLSHNLIQTKAKNSIITYTDGKILPGPYEIFISKTFRVGAKHPSSSIEVPVLPSPDVTREDMAQIVAFDLYEKTCHIDHTQQTYYMPAERIDIVQSYRQLIAGTSNRKDPMEYKPVSVHGLIGTTVDMMRALATMPKTRVNTKRLQKKWRQTYWAGRLN